MVQMAGLEPARFYPRDFKSLVSADSTTSANIKDFTRFEA